MKLVYLVHGTWPCGPFRRVKPKEKSNWFHKESPLSKQIKDRFGADVQIEVFIWSGSNSVSKRSKAAYDLASRVVTDAELYEVEDVIFIAHSHGGTVVIEALYRYSKLFDSLGINISRVICMASPFVYLSRIDDRQREHSLDLMTELFCAACVLGILGFAPDFLRLPWYVLFGVWGVVHYLAYGVIGITSEFLTPSGRILAEFLPEPSGQLISVDIIRAPADEASGLIGFASFTKWLFTKVYVVAHRTPTNWEEMKESFRFQSIGWRVFSALFTYPAFYMLLLMFSYNIGTLPYENVAVVVVAAHQVVLGVPAFLTYVVYALVCGLLSIKRWGLVDLNMEPSPPNSKVTMYLIQPDLNGKGLAHGLHSWPSVHAYILDLLSVHFIQKIHRQPSEIAIKPD